MLILLLTTHICEPGGPVHRLKKCESRVTLQPWNMAIEHMRTHEIHEMIHFFLHEPNGMMPHQHYLVFMNFPRFSQSQNLKTTFFFSWKEEISMTQITAMAHFWFSLPGSWAAGSLHNRWVMAMGTVGRQGLSRQWLMEPPSFIFSTRGAIKCGSSEVELIFDISK